MSEAEKSGVCGVSMSRRGAVPGKRCNVHYVADKAVRGGRCEVILFRVHHQLEPTARPATLLGRCS